MKFLKKHRFKFIISTLVMLLVVVSFYMLWIHVPYSKHHNQHVKIRSEIVQKHNFVYDEYFNEYYSDKTYYIVKVRENDEQQYIVCDEKQNILTNYTGEIVSESNVEAQFEEKYNEKASTIEIGYENQMLVYAITYKGKDSLIYAFYNLATGEFVKAYQL